MILHYLGKTAVGRSYIAKVSRWLYRPTAEGVEFVLLPWTWLYFLALLFKSLMPRSMMRLPRSIPIWVVGNITLGGTGKTPIVIALAQYLQQQGYKPGILVRGYGVHNKTVQKIMRQSDLAETNLPDEAQLIWQHTQCPIMISRDRQKALHYLVSNSDCNIILADDGMQNHALPRHHEIVVIDGTRGIGNGQLLPLGPLREPLLRLRMVSAVVVKIQGEIPNKKEQALLDRLQKLIGEQTVLTTMQLKLQSLSLVSNATQQVGLETFQNKPVVAIAGIGDPEQFFTSLRNAGLAIQRTVEFPDHYDYQAKDLLELGESPIVMTEKDAVKCVTFAKSNHWQVHAQAQLTPDFLQTCQHWLAQPLA
jgi:tetraacyldisaccharide 4'-kinase